jgi:hypothetical protein
MLVGITLSPLKSGFADAPGRGAGDVDLYLAEAARIQAGESYYQAAKEELESRGYPTQSFLNWRTPLPVWLAGVLPPGWAQGILIALSAVTLLAAGHVIARDAGLGRAVVASLLLVGALLPVVLAGCYIMPEVWCGVFIAASLAAYGLGRRGCAVLLGLAALFVRELAAPYCAACACLAIADRRWRELGDWLMGAAAYALFYAWHLTNVLPLIEFGARGHAEGWIQFGGAAFVISLVQMNTYLLLMPQWVSAVYLVLALLGFAALAGDWGRRAAWAAIAYTLFFGVVGQPFNQFWGALIAPLFCFGAAQGTAAAIDLVRAARLPHATWSSEEAVI